MRAALKELGDEHYVYILWRRDGGDLVPFYVGMGRKQRALQHEETYQCSRRNRRKGAEVARARAAGGVFYTVWKQGLSRQDACSAERSLIGKLGRRSNGTGVLTNLTDGGEGAAPGAEHPRARPVRVEGKRYAWLSAAADELGRTTMCVRHRIRAGWPGYYYEDEGQLPTQKGIRGPHKELRPARRRAAVIIEGTRYSTTTDAERAIGLCASSIRYRCGNPEYPDWRYEDASAQRTAEEMRQKRIATTAPPVMLDGVSYPNLTAAIRAARDQRRRIVCITTAEE